MNARALRKRIHGLSCRNREEQTAEARMIVGKVKLSLRHDGYRESSYWNELTLLDKARNCTERPGVGS